MATGTDPMDDERFYEEVAAELRRGVRREGLWAKALADSGLNEDAAKAAYLRLRVQQLKHAARVAAKEERRRQKARAPADRAAAELEFRRRWDEEARVATGWRRLRYSPVPLLLMVAVIMLACVLLILITS